MNDRVVITMAIATMGATASLAGLPGKPSGLRPAEIPNRAMSDNDKARAMTNDFAICMVKRNAKASVAALSMTPYASSFQALRQLASNNCIDAGGLQMPVTLLRGAMFRALYLRDFRKAAPVGEQTIVNYAADAASTTAEQGLVTLRSFASCVSHADPGASRALVVATVATPAEAEAIDRLRPRLADCLKGGTLKMSRGMLQGLVAETLYREAPRLVSARQGVN